MLLAQLVLGYDDLEPMTRAACAGDIIEIERLLELRREKYEEERTAELHEQLNAEKVEQIRQQIIEEERKRMLAAHAANLGLKHLPKGVLSTEQDMELFATK